jgi:hypothetical protein
MRTLVRAVLGLALWAVAGAALAANVTGIPADLGEMELYASPDAPNAAKVVKPGEVAFPIPILEVSKATGMLKVRVQGKDYWVISDDVQHDMDRAVQAGCEPKMAGNLVAHGKRGAGEGCK